MNASEIPAHARKSPAETENKPLKPKKGDPGWIEAYRRELFALRQLGCFIPDEVFPRSAP